jgi:hypothetical protein
MEDITADADYGSEDNQDYHQEQGITAYMKYNTFFKEQDKNYQKKHKPLVNRIYIINQKKIIICVL